MTASNGPAAESNWWTRKPGAIATRSNSAIGAAVRNLSLRRRPLRGGGNLHGLVVDDLGQVIVSMGGKLRVFGGSGARRTGSPLNGLAGGMVFAVTRSFDNTDGVSFLATLDYNVDPPPETPADEPPPPSPTPQPNLIVTGLQNSSSIIVKNTGDADAGPFSVEIADRSGAKSTIRFAAGLAAGSQAAVPTYTCMSGRTFTADILGEVTESDEGDNTFSCG